MEGKELTIENEIHRNVYIFCGLIILLLFVSRIYEYKSSKDIDILFIFYYFIIGLIGTYLFFHRQIKLIITDNELQIKWSGSRKWYKFPLNSINKVKFNSSRIEINYLNNKTTFTFNLSKNTEKLKVKQFLITNLGSKYQLG